MFQSEKVELEGECRAKNDQLAVREAEVEQIPVLRNELEKLRVRMSKILTCSKFFYFPPPPPPPPLPLQTERSGMEEACQGKDDVMAVKEQEIAAKQRALSEAEQQVGSLAEECAALNGKLEGNTEQILSLQVDIETLQVLHVLLRLCCTFLLVSYLMYHFLN